MNYIAWVTVDRAYLVQHRADVVVLRDEKDVDPGENNEPLFSAVTTISVESDNNDDAIREAESLLANAGWQVVSDWEPVPTGCIAVVHRLA